MLFFVVSKRSPLDKGLEDAVKHRVLAPESIHNRLDCRVLLALLVNHCLCLILPNRWCQPLGCSLTKPTGLKG